MSVTIRVLFFTLLLLLLLGVVGSADAQNTSVNGTGNVTLAPVSPKKDKASMTWEAWLIIVVIVVLLFTLVLDLSPVSSAMVFTSMFLYLSTMVDKTELFSGFVNNGVLSIAILFIIVHPLAELPLVKKLVLFTMSGGSKENTRWPLFKLTLLSLALSSFVENTPHVAMFTPLVAKFCIDNGLAPSQFLMPMNFAVILGNFAVVGCSSSLVITGLMEDAGLGPMNFFELALVGLPTAPFILAYLVFMPKYLLPNDKGGMMTVSAKKQRVFNMKLRLLPDSTLIGKTYGGEHTFSTTFPGGDTENVIVSSVSRAGSEEKLSSSIADIAKEGDVVYLAGAPTVVLQSMDILGYELITANDNVADDVVNNYCNKAAISSHNEPMDDEELVEQSTVPPCDLHMTPPPTADEMESGAPMIKKQLVEVVLSPSNVAIGADVSSRTFQLNYTASIISIRCGGSGEDVEPAEMSSHRLTIGDTLLLFAPTTFKKQYDNSGEFLLINPYSADIDPLNPFIFSFPKWFPFGTLVGEKTEKPRKVLIFPPEYQYLTLIIFLWIVIMAVFHYPLAVLCLGGAIMYVLLGIVSTSQAIKMIHLEVYVLVAFSFPLGLAVKSSGLAAVIGDAVTDAEIKGFWLLLVISVITVIATNLITNKAACQVMFPIIIAVYEAQGRDPLPAIMVSAMVVVYALCTPYAIPPNVLVMGPGGYMGVDYLKFGLPLTIMGTILTPLAAAAVYNDW